jgi:hypothetical protein
MTPAEIIQIVKDCLTGTAAITGATVAVLGLRTWKRQLRGNAEYDVTRRLLRAAYKIRDAISRVRQPFMSMGEIGAAVRETARSPQEPRGYNRAVFEVRWKEALEAGNELKIAELEGEVLWGNSLKTAIAPLEERVKELSIALSEFLRYDDKEDLDVAQREIKDEYADTVYDRGRPERPDTFTKAVNQSVDQLEAFLRPKLKL